MCCMDPQGDNKILQNRCFSSATVETLLPKHGFPKLFTGKLTLAWKVKCFEKNSEIAFLFLKHKICFGNKCCSDATTGKHLAQQSCGNITPTIVYLTNGKTFTWCFWKSSEIFLFFEHKICSCVCAKKVKHLGKPCFRLNIVSGTMFACLRGPLLRIPEGNFQ